MKKYLFNRYKVINLALLIITITAYVFLERNMSEDFCISDCSRELKRGIIHPLQEISKYMIPILVSLLLVPAHIFRKWLLVLLPFFSIVSYTRLSTISVNEYGGILQWSRTGMAELLTVSFAVLTLIFVVAHLIYDWKKKK